MEILPLMFYRKRRKSGFFVICYIILLYFFALELYNKRNIDLRKICDYYNSLFKRSFSKNKYIGKVELENLKETYSKLLHVFLHFEIEICVPSIVKEHKYNKREDFIDFVHCISSVPRTMPVNIRL